MMDCLIFDLDGTISDPQIGITRSINHALEHHGYAPHPPENLTRYIGPPLDQTFEELIKDDPRASPADLVVTYRTRYAKLGYRENTLYNGIPECLAHFKQRGVRMGVCTSKPIKFARPILKMFGLIDYFEFISGGDIGISKAQQLTQLLADNAITRRSIMIGDRAIDVSSAKDNGLKSAGVLWGFGSRTEIDTATPDVILERVEDLHGLA